MHGPRSTAKSARVLLLAAVSVTAVLAVTSCSRGEEPQAGPTTASPAPTPTRAPAEPVSGKVEVETISVHTGEPVFNAGAPQAAEPGTDDAAVQAFVGAVSTWMDAHLDDLQRGGSGDLEAVAAPGLLQSGTPETVIGITTALASEDRLVERAVYHVTVAVDGGPWWASVHLVVKPREGKRVAADFTFTPGDEGPMLEAAGPAPVKEAGS